VVLAEPGFGVLSADARKLEVWGDPIAHSRSPELHAAAYDVLGLDWTYGRRRVAEEAFAGELASLDATWRGLSLTMPLKGAAFAASVSRDRHAELTGAVNTLVLASSGPLGFNTDVGGIIAALADEGIERVTRARLVGAGATATSALVALAEIGARRVDVVARRPEAVERLRALGERMDVEIVALPFGAPAYDDVPLTIATLPGDAPLAVDVADGLAAAGGVLLDVVYGHWPTALSAAWERAGRVARSGLGMLLHQAVRQIRVFTTGDASASLPEEARVLAAMRRALEPART
jgi:shikimate dehydrogenase